ncbi:MAG: hypothetical protein ACX930_12635 [Erythrobacter sp.]
MYSMSASHSQNRVTIDFGDSYEFDQSQFESDLKSAIERVRGREGEFDLLSDFSKAGVMDQSRASESQKVVAWCAANGLRKAANVMGSLIHTMQVKRLSKQDERFGYFQTVGEAERWLDG